MSCFEITNELIAHDLAVAKVSDKELSPEETKQEYQKYYSLYLEQLNKQVTLADTKAFKRLF